MKIKIIFFLIVMCSLIFIIYLFNKDDKIYYFNVSDNNYEFKTYNTLLMNNIKDLEKYVNYAPGNDYRITDLLRDIEDNKKIEDKTIQNILIKADITTIKFGENELKYKISSSNMNDLFDYVDELIIDIDRLLSIVRKYSKEKIYFIGFYNQNEFYSELYRYLNIKVKDLCDNYNIFYIEINDEFSEQENINIYKRIIKKINI